MPASLPASLHAYVWPSRLQKEFEGTGGVLLDVSHAKPHPYHGEPGRHCFSGMHMLLLPLLLPLLLLLPVAAPHRLCPAHA